MINSKPIARRKLILPDQGLNMHESPELSPEFIEALKQVSKADLSCIVTYQQYARAKLELTLITDNDIKQNQNLAFNAVHGKTLRSMNRGE